MFEGQEVLVSYAKYLIEYLESVLEPGGRLNGFGAGRVTQLGLARLLVNYGFENQGNNYWTREWMSSWVEVISSGHSLRWFIADENGDEGELADQVIGDVTAEDLERFIMQADYFDEHGRRMPRGRTFHGVRR